MADMLEAAKRFTWETQPRATRFLIALVDNFSKGNRFAAALTTRLLSETGTRFFDWLDHIGAPDVTSGELIGLGFEPTDDDSTTWSHPGGLLPRLRNTRRPALAIKVENLDDFIAAQGIAENVAASGQPGSRFRQAELSSTDPVSFVAVERHGYRGFEPVEATDSELRQVEKWIGQFENRPRLLTNEGDHFATAASLFDECQSRLGRDWACDLFFQTERRYWQSRNRAAVVQYQRQSRLGLGWANHDHHTYRSSRGHFARLISVLEQMGFRCRERFYAGHDAGWGAQVLEQPIAGITIFADVDMAPEEISDDFAHHGLNERTELGTVGLWCKLHGESFLHAGMHHLECQFDFTAAQQQLAAVGVATMAPFTDFSFLKQAFTQGEVWPVDAGRLATLSAAGSITAEQATQFACHGALGSHLEILERNDGYKGFNQTGISDIIHRTDPRLRRRDKN